MYGYVGLCIIMYGYVSKARHDVLLNRAMYGYVGLCMAVYGYVGLYRAMYG